MADAEAQLRRIAKRIRRLDDRMEDLTPVWPKVGAYIARMNAKSFATRGASTGHPWKPLAAATLRSKMLGGFGRAPLVRSGDMKRSFTGRPMGVERYSRQEAVFGSDSVVGLWQQGGTFRNGRRHIPPRRIQHVNPNDKKEIARIILKYVLK